TAQVRLLRVLQDGEFTRVGGNEVLKADVRIVAASNVDLERAADQGKFRRDLFYRLSVFPISLPPLRERREDIHPLVIHFLEYYKQRTGRFVSGISKDALRALVVPKPPAKAAARSSKSRCPPQWTTLNGRRSKRRWITLQATRPRPHDC